MEKYQAGQSDIKKRLKLKKKKCSLYYYSSEQKYSGI